jgi:hypothetical protein
VPLPPAFLDLLPEAERSAGRLRAKVGTIVKFVPGRKGTAAQVGTPLEALESRSLCGIVGVIFRY